MTSLLCRWCGKGLDVVVNGDGLPIARQCPLCQAWAPLGQDVGEHAAFRGVTAAEARARREAKAARRAKQLDLVRGVK